MVIVPAQSPIPAAAHDSAPAVVALVIDRQPLFQAALANLLGSTPLRAMVRTASRSDAGLEIIRSSAIDIVFCELHAEPISGVELVQALADENLHVAVVLLGEDGDEAVLAAAMTSGAAGLFTKNSTFDELLAGVTAVLSGHRAIASGLLRPLAERMVSPSSHLARRASHLSPTEIEILTMIARADSIPAIAASRGISRKTVRNHLAKIYRKLELHGRTEAMLWATRMGLPGN